MAIYSNTAIARRLKKSAGEQTFCRLKGQNIVKMKIEENTSNTPAQQRQRLAFTELSDLELLFEEAATIGFPSRPAYMTPSNAFMQANAGVVTVSEEGVVTVNYEKIACSKGRLKVPDMTVEANGENHTLTFTHIPKKNGLHRKSTDRLYAVVWEKQAEETGLFELNKRSDTESVTVQLDKEWSMADLCVYVFVLSEKGDKASDTTYVEVKNA